MTVRTSRHTAILSNAAVMTSRIGLCPLCRGCFWPCSVSVLAPASPVKLTLTLLTWTIWRAPTNASKWRMGFNSAFKGLMKRFDRFHCGVILPACDVSLGKLTRRFERICCLHLKGPHGVLG
jgi:hypothetical protein